MKALALIAFFASVSAFAGTQKMTLTMMNEARPMTDAFRAQCMAKGAELDMRLQGMNAEKNLRALAEANEVRVLRTCGLGRDSEIGCTFETTSVCTVELISLDSKLGFKTMKTEKRRMNGERADSVCFKDLMNVKTQKNTVDARITKSGMLKGRSCRVESVAVVSQN
jgi:hypothetical protein